MNMATVKSFVKQFVASVKGDGVEVQAEKVFRQAQSALRTQIASLEGDTIRLEDVVADATEARTKARINNGSPISNRTSYVDALITYKNAEVDAKKTLKTHLDKIAFLKEELATLETEVEA